MDITRNTAHTVSTVIEGAGETVKGISEKTGLAYATLYRKLNYADSAPLNVKELGTIAAALGVSVLDLIGTPEQDAA